MNRKKGFTLIELLIVVAIIAILAAIAIPNFLEAQTRSKVSRAKADMRSLVLAIESYHLDNKYYPPPYYENALSTPIAYISSGRYSDPFGSTDINDGSHYYRYAPWDKRDPIAQAFYQGVLVPKGMTEEEREALTKHRFFIYSNGPDRTAEVYNFTSPPGTVVPAGGAAWLSALGDQFISMRTTAESIYDPTNGTTSRGDVFRTGAGELTGPLI